MSSDNFIEAIRTGNIAYLEEFLNQHPEQLQKKLESWKAGNISYGGGSALHCAATYNQPEVIRFLVERKKADIHQQISNDDGGALWSPLHYAARAQSCQAAAMLIQLGAHPFLLNAAGKNTVEFCQSQQVKQFLDPDYLKKQEQEREQEKQKKIDGIWTRNTPQEVMHDYELPHNQYRLTDIFNFEARTWRTLVKDPSNNGVTHSVVFFDDMADTEILHQALGKLKDLGGEANESSIDSRVLRGKPSLSKRL